MKRLTLRQPLPEKPMYDMTFQASITPFRLLSYLSAGQDVDYSQSSSLWSVNRTFTPKRTANMLYCTCNTFWR